MTALFVSSIEDKNRLECIKGSVDEWLGDSERRYSKIEQGSAFVYNSSYFGPPLPNEQKTLVDYSFIAGYCSTNLADALVEKESFFKERRVLAAYDKNANLQGVAILLLRNSKKGSPFVEVEYLLTAYGNMPLNGPKVPYRMRGSGSALIAQAAQISECSKILYVLSTKLAKCFYIKLGFVPTKRQKLKSSRTFKLLKSEFEGLVKKQSAVLFCPESSLPFDLRKGLLDIQIVLKNRDKDEEKKQMPIKGSKRPL